MDEKNEGLKSPRKRLMLIVVAVVVIAAALGLGFALDRMGGTVGGREGIQQPSALSNTPPTETNERQVQRLFAIQRANDIRALVLELDIIHECIVIVNLGEDPQPGQPERAATVSMTLLLNENDMLTGQQLQWIVENIRLAVPGITDDNISISDNNFNNYLVSNIEKMIAELEEEPPPWTSAGPDHESLRFNSVEEASKYMSFPISQPSVLPENARPESVFLTRQIGHDSASRVSIFYRLEEDGFAYNPLTNSYGHASIVLGQAYYGPGAATYIWSLIPLFEPNPEDLSSGREFETVRISINGKRAALTAYFLPVLLGLEEPPDDYEINAFIFWYDGDYVFQMLAFAPGDVFNLDTLIAIAESVG